MPQTHSKTSEKLPAFISRQVTASRHFFMNLEPDPQSEFEIVCGGMEQVRSDYWIERSAFPFYGIELVASGEGLLTIHGQTHPLSAGSLFAYGPHTPHKIQNATRSGMKKYYLDLFGMRVTQHLMEAHLQSVEKVFTPTWVRGVHELAGVFDMLIHEATLPRPRARSICEVLTQLLFLKIQQLGRTEGSVRGKAYDTYERICLFIDEHFLSLRSAQDIAAQCGVTSMYLSRLFKRYSDSGPYHYLLRLKMNYAASLLVEEDISVQETAERIGMMDPFQFSRCFKRVCGYPPSRLTKTGR